MLVPPPPIPTPNGYSSAASTNGRLMLEETRWVTNSLSRRDVKRCILSSFDTINAVQTTITSRPALESDLSSRLNKA